METLGSSREYRKDRTILIDLHVGDCTNMYSVHSYAKLWRTPNIYKRCTSRLHYIGERSSPIKKFHNPLHVLVLQSLHPKIHTMTTIRDIIKSIARKYLPFSQATLAWKTPSLHSNEFSISCSI